MAYGGCAYIMTNKPRGLVNKETLDLITKVFMPEAVDQGERIRKNGTRFVHYTSAESGIAILRSGNIFLRNSSLMNDFSEVQHGFDCLSTAYNGAAGVRLKAAMRHVQEDLPEVFEESFDNQFQDVRQETYLLSISEHGESENGHQLEDEFGRLSMWRAYANRNGVAFVFNNTPFMKESNALNVFSSPVVYATAESFTPYFAKIVTGVEGNLELINSLGGEFLHEMLMHAFRFAIQSTKHPSFHEEREWRVIYSPTILQRRGEHTQVQLDRIPTEIETLNGIPQRVYAIPFKDYPDEGFTGATIPALLERVLIGPSMDAYPIAQAFVAELNRCGVVNAAEKVKITGVPLRI